jgi:hypothetical protein
MNEKLYMDYSAKDIHVEIYGQAFACSGLPEK